MIIYTKHTGLRQNDSNFYPPIRQETCCYWAEAELDALLRAGALSLCAADRDGRVFLHQAIDTQCGAGVWRLLWVAGEVEARALEAEPPPLEELAVELAARGKRAADDYNGPPHLVGYYHPPVDVLDAYGMSSWYAVDAGGGPPRMHTSRAPQTPLDHAAHWGLRDACRYWAQRASPSTVSRAVAEAYASSWSDCAAALVEGGWEGGAARSLVSRGERWGRQRWSFRPRRAVWSLSADIHVGCGRAQ